MKTLEVSPSGSIDDTPSLQVENNAVKESAGGFCYDTGMSLALLDSVELHTFLASFEQGVIKIVVLDVQAQGVREVTPENVLSPFCAPRTPCLIHPFGLSYPFFS